MKILQPNHKVRRQGRRARVQSESGLYCSYLRAAREVFHSFTKKNCYHYYYCYCNCNCIPESSLNKSAYETPILARSKKKKACADPFCAVLHCNVVLGSLGPAARPAGLPILSSFGCCRVERGVPGALREFTVHSICYFIST